MKKKDMIKLRKKLLATGVLTAEGVFTCDYEFASLHEAACIVSGDHKADEMDLWAVGGKSLAEIRDEAVDIATKVVEKLILDMGAAAASKITQLDYDDMMEIAIMAAVGGITSTNKKDEI